MALPRFWPGHVWANGPEKSTVRSQCRRFLSISVMIYFTYRLPGGGMPYMCHTETCRRSGYTFWPSNPRQGVFFEPDSKTGCQISEPGCLFTVLFGTLPLILTYLSFVQEINLSFDVFNIFIVIISPTVEEFVRVSFENDSFLCFDTLLGWLLAFPSSNLPPPQQKDWFNNNRKIRITKEICITIDPPKKSLEENQAPRQGVCLKISLQNRVAL